MRDFRTIDFETWLFRPGRMAPKPVVLAVGGDDGERLNVGDDMRRTLVRFYDQASHGIPVVGQFIAYDNAVAMEAWPELTKPIFSAYDAGGIVDTAVTEKLIDIARGRLGTDGRGYSLEDMAKRRLGLTMNKFTWRMRYADLDGVPLPQWPEGARDYPLGDVRATGALLRDQYARAEKISYSLPDLAAQCRGSFALHLMACWGVRTDGAFLERSRAAVARGLDVLRPELRRAGLMDARGKRSNKALQEIVVSEMGARTPRTPKGRACIDADTLEDLTAPAARLWVAYAGLEKLDSTYFEPLQEGVSLPIHARYDSLKESGRTSCVAKGTLIDTVRDVAVFPKGVPIEDVRAGDRVYCFDFEGRLRIRPVREAGMTGTREVVRIRWRGQGRKHRGHLDITPEHLVRRSTGEFVRADSLQPGDSLAALSRGVSAGYARMWATNVGEIGREHRLVFSEVFGSIPEHVHHHNGNKLDNRPENLEGMTSREHCSKHASNPSSELRAKRADAMRARWARGEIEPRRGVYAANWLGLDRAWLLSELHSCGGSPTKLARTHGIDYTTLLKYFVLTNIDVAKVSRLFNRRGERLNRAFVQRVRGLFEARNTEKARIATGLGYYKFAELQRQLGFEPVYNHTVESVEILEDPLDVYDLVVAEHHNFIAGEICVHNCSSPNWQNLPRGTIGSTIARLDEPLLASVMSVIGPSFEDSARGAVVARPGFVLVSCDFDSQEMRCWAQACLTLVGHSRLAERYQQDPDFDPHAALASTCLLKIPEDEGLARKRAGDAAMKKARQSAKIPNFGMPGGMGVGGLIRYARGYGEQWADPKNCAGCAGAAAGDEYGGASKAHHCYARRLRDAWFHQWPEAREYFAFVDSVVGGGIGDITQLVSDRRRGSVGYCDAANTIFQGLAADASKAALYEVTRRCYSVETSALYGCRPTFFIHDEVIIEAPEWKAHEAAVEMEEVFIEQMSRYTPDVPVRASAHMMRRWHKNAATALDRGGRIIPWEDR